MGFQKNGEVQLLLLWRPDMMREGFEGTERFCADVMVCVCQRQAFRNLEKQLSRHTYDAPNATLESGNTQHALQTGTRCI